jgi:hypothetical protein
MKSEGFVLTSEACPNHRRAARKPERAKSLLRDCPQLTQIGSARIARGLRMFSSARSRESALVPDFAFLGPEDDDATGHQ